KNVQMGSIGGGGRYDDLTGLFGVKGIPGVGISFGVDRIYDVMEELNLFPANTNKSGTALFFNLGEEECKAALKYGRLLRKENISCEVFHEQARFDKQFKYAERKHIPYVIIIGTKELESGNCIIKELASGEQVEKRLEDLVSFFKSQN
ncbi:MAG TPA: His/Gly/Thr/Pro-type tRNA ligase C-terminal domain-containing protein, partial [Parasegetibacter sp.]